VVRTLILWRRTGGRGHRLPARPAAPRWWAPLVLPAGALAVPAAPVAELTGLDPLGVLDRPVIRGLGVVLATLGILAVFAARLALGDSWRVGVDESERTAQVTSGPFRVVRNLIFTAAAVAFAGFTFMVPNTVALAGLALVFIGIWVQVRLVEEPHLRCIHSAAYLRHAARVGHFVPGVRRLHATSHPPPADRGAGAAAPSPHRRRKEPDHG
jgi:protein-S-isoprenylcysteine O-methyltransferase Ste14